MPNNERKTVDKKKGILLCELTADDEKVCRQVFKAVKGHKLELGVIFGAFYGLRRSEMIGLRWESINLKANTITVEYTVTVASVDGKSVVVAADTANRK